MVFVICWSQLIPYEASGKFHYFRNIRPYTTLINIVTAYWISLIHFRIWRNIIVMWLLWKTNNETVKYWFKSHFLWHAYALFEVHFRLLRVHLLNSFYFRKQQNNLSYPFCDMLFTIDPEDFTTFAILGHTLIFLIS